MEATDSRILRMLERIWLVVMNVWSVGDSTIKVSFSDNSPTNPIYVEMKDL